VATKLKFLSLEMNNVFLLSLPIPWPPLSVISVL
jgi:hypothetical protein